MRFQGRWRRGRVIVVRRQAGGGVESAESPLVTGQYGEERQRGARALPTDTYHESRMDAPLRTETYRGNALVEAEDSGSPFPEWNPADLPPFDTGQALPLQRGAGPGIRAALRSRGIV